MRWAASSYIILGLRREIIVKGELQLPKCIHWWTFTVRFSCFNPSEVSQVLFFLIYSILLERVILNFASEPAARDCEERGGLREHIPMPWLYTGSGLEGISEVASLEAVFWKLPTSGQLWAKWFPLSVSASETAHITFRGTPFLLWQVQTELSRSCVMLTSVPWTFHSVAPSLPSGVTKNSLQTQLHKVAFISLGVSSFSA